MSYARRPMRLFNSLGRELQVFEPVEAGRVRMYSCGPTVYTYAHIGNLRAYLCMDTLRRTLEWKGYDVFHVMNITDVGHLVSDADEGEDKIELAASRTGRSVWDLTALYTEDFQQNLQHLNILSPCLYPKATEHIQEMIAFAVQLEAGGYTYLLDDGLYFDTGKVPGYGALGLLDLGHQLEGARVQAKVGKRQPHDFALWRKSPRDRQRLMEWDSPWGRGCPGWHLECSVMSLKYLGSPFDIHTGGVDHQQIHHVNEIAQNQGFRRSGHPGANYWLHNEFLVLDDEKMSKSAGDFLRLQSLIDWGIHPLVFRFFNLQAHYRSHLAFNLDALVAARSGLQRLLLRINAAGDRARTADWMSRLAEARFSRGGAFTFALSSVVAGMSPAARTWLATFDDSISDDLATPRALAALIDAGTSKDLDADNYLRLVGACDLVLGLDLLTLDPKVLDMRPASPRITEVEVDALLEERRLARQAKDFARADAIRQQLVEAGVQVMDGTGGASSEWCWLPRRG